MAKIACFEVEQWMGPVLKKALPKHQLVLKEEPLSQKNVSLAKDAEILVIFIYSKVSKELLNSMPKLRLVATRSTGFDHIDLKECISRKITICNVPFYGENTVAEHAMALILSISRRIPESVERTRKGDFSYAGLRGFDLKGKTLGVMGSGHIGLNVIKFAKAFDMNVIVYDLFQNKEAASNLGFTYLPFDEVLSRSDIITLHTPYTPKTHHMINKGNISKLKKGAVIINTARGGLIESQALLQAIDKGIVAYAGLDVLEGEDLVKDECRIFSDEPTRPDELKLLLFDEMLLKHPKVFVTPHNAFNSQEALNRILTTTVENINSFLSGKAQNVIKGCV